MKANKFHRYYLRLFISFIFLSIAACSNKELSRSTAADLIINSDVFKQPAVINLNEGVRGSDNPGLVEVLDNNDTPEAAVNRYLKIYGEEYPPIALALHLGLTNPKIKTRETVAPKKGWLDDRVYWKLDQDFPSSDKAKAYWKDYNLPVSDYGVPYAHRELIEITGINKQNESQAIVEYSYKWVPNEIGSYLDPNSAEFASLPFELQQLLKGERGPMMLGSRKVSTTNWNSTSRTVAYFTKYDDGWRLTRAY